MTETAGIHFGPAWLRDTFVQPPQGVEHSGNSGNGGGSKMASNLNVMAPAKLAEFRYGREEMLALFSLPQSATNDPTLPPYQEKVVANIGLLAERPQPPLNLMGPMSEEEQRAWQKGANSDTSLRLYKKEMPNMAGGPGMGRGGGGERGRGRGRGFFDRHRAPMDDEDGVGGRREEGGGGRGFGRGRPYDRSLSDRGSWFDRSNSGSAAGGQPGEEVTNGNISPRKGYSRAPFDDWRKPQGPGGDEGNEDGGGWRNGPSSSGRRWNAPPGGGEGGQGRGGGSGGWRTEERKYSGSGEHHNGSSSRWHRESNDEHYTNRRGGFSQGRPGFNRTRSRQDSDIPEWATEDISDADKAGGGFDSSGKFSSNLDQKPKRVIHLNREHREDNNGDQMPIIQPQQNEDEAFEDEEVDVDDLPENLQRQVKIPEEQPNSAWHQNQAEHDLVSKLIEDDEVPEQAPPASAPQVPQEQHKENGQIPSVQQIQWYYLDPKNDEHGPFTSSDMLEWLEAGYFPPDLRLRRAGIDRRFAALNEMSRLYGRVPFTPGPAPGPLQPEQPPPQPQPQPQLPTPPPPSMQQSSSSPVTNNVQQQFFMQQQAFLLHQRQQLIAIQSQPHLSELEKAQLINKIMQMTLLPQPNSSSPQPNNSSGANDLAMQLLNNQQNQQPPQMKSPPIEQPPIMSSSAESGLQLLGNLNSQPQNSEPEPPFNPIKSLLRQLQQQAEDQHKEEERSDPSPQQTEFILQQQQQQNVSPSPPPLQHQSPQVPRSIWGGNNQASEHQPKVGLGVWGEDSSQSRESPNSFYNQVQQQRDSSLQPFVEEDQEDSSTGFMKPKSNEKKDKKAKRAEEKKRAREREARKAAALNSDLIPGMEGYSRPPQEHEDNGDEMLEQPQQRPYEAVTEAVDVLEEQEQPQYQPKLAPWARVAEQAPSNGPEASLSLAEIQKMEEEREREAKMRRDIQEAANARARQEEEQRRQQSIALNWASAVNMDGGGQKSLAEIQAEEQRQERERQERERREKKARQKDMSLAQASVWGSASTNLSWASKTAQFSNSPQPSQPQPPPPQKEQPPIQQNTTQNIGFWDNNTEAVAPVAKSSQSQQPKKNKSKANKAKEESKVAAIFQSKGKPGNEFEEWCISALEKLDPQVDIPTFLGFLNDVESPYEVNDYVKNYIGDGKGPKNFAKEYIERRSKWRNSLKSQRNVEDDLLTPAAAINPNEPDQDVPVVGGMMAAGGNNQGNRRNKKKNKSKSKLDASHLLGFSVSASDRPNAGELDLPQ